jgi:hypothetical protein
MGELIRLEERRRTDGPRVLIALEDALFVWMPEPHSFVVDQTCVVYVAAGTLNDPEHEADLWVGRYVPSAPGRSLLFQTLSGATYETDADRRIWRGGELVSAGTLIDFGVPETSEIGILRTRRSAALLFMTPARNGWRLRVRVTTSLLLIGHLPSIPRRPPAPPAWLSAARQLLANRNGAA